MTRTHRRASTGAALALALALATIPGVSAALARTPTRAHSARTISLHDSGYLHLTSHHGFTLNEQGNAYGTISGTIYIHLKVTSTNHVTAEVNIYPNGGSVTGYANAGYRSSGGYASFNGNITIARGTGRYSHAHGSGLNFNGTIQRNNDAVTVHVNGNMFT